MLYELSMLQPAQLVHLRQPDAAAVPVQPDDAAGTASGVPAAAAAEARRPAAAHGRISRYIVSYILLVIRNLRKYTF